MIPLSPRCGLLPLYLWLLLSEKHIRCINDSTAESRSLQGKFSRLSKNSLKSPSSSINQQKYERMSTGPSEVMVPPIIKIRLHKLAMSLVTTPVTWYTALPLQSSHSYDDIQAPDGFLQSKFIAPFGKQYLRYAKDSVLQPVLNTEHPPKGLYILILTAVRLPFVCLVAIVDHRPGRWNVLSWRS
jgi:hypothetical protein